MSAAPAKDKKMIVVVSIFGALLLVFVVYAYTSFFGGTTNPAAVSAPASEPVTGQSKGNAVRSAGSANNENSPANGKSGLGVAPGIAATKMASTSSSLDPTLDESAMLRTESLVYSGTGRNIFSSISAPPPMMIPKNVPSARPGAALALGPPVPTGPPPPPPIKLKYFGTAVRSNGVRQAFLLDGEDVYLASEGDIVARRYKIVSIGVTSIRIEDLVYNDTQSLPLLTAGGNVPAMGPRISLNSNPAGVGPSNQPPGRSFGNSPGNSSAPPFRGGLRGLSQHSFQNSIQN